MGHISYCELRIHFEDTLYFKCVVWWEQRAMGDESLVAIKFGKSIHHTPTPLRGEH
jgi:hypothetical protein